MKHIKCFEEYDIINNKFQDNNYNFFFKTKNYNYIVSLTKFNDSNYYSLGFKAKKDDDYFYDMSLITNENPYEVMKTIIKVANLFIDEKTKEINDYNNKFNLNLKLKDVLSGFIFSFTGDKKKNEQRLKLYSRYIPETMKLTFKDGIYYLDIIQ